ncbi:MAG TPA: ABC transporter permease [Actinotalea sp.]|nr:ABC transporter permease [Actinotalea sp.]
MSGTTEQRAAGTPAPPTLAVLVGLVARREIVTQVRSKSFLISSAIVLAIVLAAIIVPSLAGGRLADLVTGGPPSIGVVGDAAGGEGTEGLDVREYPDEASAREAVREREVDAAVVPSGDSPTGATLVVRSEVPGDLLDRLSLRPEVERLEPGARGEALAFLVPFAFGLVFFMAAVGSGMMIAQNTVQEKQTRVVEILLAAVPARALMAGKILGNATVAIGQVVAIAGVAVLGLVLTGQDDVLTLLSAPMSWFLAFFLLGFLLVAAMFAAAGSLVSRLEDVGTVVQPAMMLIMIPYFGVVFFSANQTVMTVLSYLPFATPVAMPARLFLGDAVWWEPLVALVLLALTTVGVITLAARVYARTLLRTGKRVTWREALRARS